MAKLFTRSAVFLLLAACQSSGPEGPPGHTAPTTQETALLSTTTVDTGSSKTASTTMVKDTSADTVPTSNACHPGGVAYGVEGEEMVLQLICTNPAVTEVYGKYIPTTIEPIDGLPKGAIWDAKSDAIHFTPGLSQAGVYTVDVVARTGDVVESGQAIFWVADAWNNPSNVDVDPIAYQEEYGLSVLHLTRPNSTSSSNYVSATMVYRGEEFDIELKYRGASSLGYPKNSYTLKFPSDHEFKDDDFEKRRKIVLTTTFDDNAYFRQKLCFDVWNMLDESHHQVQTMFAVVYINGEYEGLYLLGDHIDGEYWEDQGYDEDGNLYKAVNHDANFYDKNDLSDGYEKKEGMPESGPNAYSDLEQFIQMVISSDDSSFEKELQEQAVVEEFMDWWALVLITNAGDSAGKNSYLYNDPKNPMWHYAPWDFNHSYGQDWMTLRVSYNYFNEFGGSNYLFSRLLNHPTFGPQLSDRWRLALDGPLHPDNINAVIDDYMNDIGPSAARDWSKWESSYRSYGGWSSYRSDWTTHEEEVQYVREWIEQRHDYFDSIYP